MPVRQLFSTTYREGNLTTKITRRRRQISATTNPKSDSDSYRELFKNPVLNMAEIIKLIQAIGREADQKRASVLIEDFRAEYPDLYNFIGDLVDLDAADARDELIKEWPWMLGMKLYKDHLRVIEFLQTQIKLRRETSRT